MQSVSCKLLFFIISTHLKKLTTDNNENAAVRKKANHPLSSQTTTHTTQFPHVAICNLTYSNRFREKKCKENAQGCAGGGSVLLRSSRRSGEIGISCLEAIGKLIEKKKITEKPEEPNAKK